ILYSSPPKTSPTIAGWSPDGKWVLFWDLADGKRQAPLDAAPVSGSGYHNVFDPVLPHEDFMTWCGKTLYVSGGGGEFPSQGQQLLVSAPPQWSTRNLSGDFRSSWIWPSCSPDGRWIAVTLTPNHTELPPGAGSRWIGLISSDG